MTMDELIAAAREAGFEDLRSLRRIARSAAVLTFGRKAKAGTIRGSKVGGLPTLVDVATWPSHKGQPLSFLAQVDLADVPPGIATELPPQGLLSFFYLAAGGSWGFDPADAGKFAVLFQPEAARLPVLQRWPEALPKDQQFGEFPIGFRESVTIPPEESALVSTLRLDNTAREAYLDLADAAGSGDGRSLLLGHPDQVQGDMSEECSFVSAGIYCGDGDDEDHPRYEELRRKALDWRLLLQLHSIEEAGMCWGDLGCLYFWIRDDDLRQRNFAGAWMILQCG